MLELSNRTNLLEQKSYKYSLQDIAEPNLLRDVYTEGAVPKVAFNHRRVPLNMPEEIWITDTSLRDGQQSVEPYSVDQIVNIYKLLNKLGGPYGIIRQPVKRISALLRTWELKRQVSLSAAAIIISSRR